MDCEVDGGRRPPGGDLRGPGEGGAAGKPAREATPGTAAYGAGGRRVGGMQAIERKGGGGLGLARRSEWTRARQGGLEVRLACRSAPACARVSSALSYAESTPCGRRGDKGCRDGPQEPPGVLGARGAGALTLPEGRTFPLFAAASQSVAPSSSSSSAAMSGNSSPGVTSRSSSRLRSSPRTLSKHFVDAVSACGRGRGG